MAHDGTGQGWDETSPSNTEPISSGDDEIRDLRKGVRIRLEKEHETPAASSAGGEHLAGSAKTYFNSVDPAKRPDGSTSLDSSDYGRLFYDTNTGELKIYTSSGWVAVKADLVEGSVETADLADGAVDENKLASSVAGDGLSGGAGSALSVGVDDSTIEISSDALRVKDNGIGSAKIADGAVGQSQLGSDIDAAIAWGCVTVASDGTPTVENSLNVQSATHVSASTFSVTFEHEMNDANYCLVVLGESVSAYGNVFVVLPEGGKTTTGFTVAFYRTDGDPYYPKSFSFVVFGTLA